LWIQSHRCKTTAAPTAHNLIFKFQDTLSEDGSKVKNVDHEYPIYFSVVDENLSWYVDKNIKEFATMPGTVDKDDEDFKESNKMNGINGRIYGNLEGLRMAKGQKINWYLLSLGTEVDMHNVHFHGQTVLAVSQTRFRRFSEYFEYFRNKKGKNF
jgi:hypothetical protein